MTSSERLRQLGVHPGRRVPSASPALAERPTFAYGHDAAQADVQTRGGVRPGGGLSRPCGGGYGRRAAVWHGDGDRGGRLAG